MGKKNKKPHITYEERVKIEGFLKDGYSYKEIANNLDRGKTTIGDEICRNGGKENYSAKRADTRAYFRQYRKKRGCNRVSMDRGLQRFVEKRLECGWSPETISKRLKTQSGMSYVSGKSIRRYIGKRHSLERLLFWNRVHKKSGPKKNKGVYLRGPDRKFIEKRYEEFNLYDLEYGHFEGDFIVSRCSSYVLLVLVERYSKYVLMSVLPNRRNTSVNERISSLLNGYHVKSLTLDNDIAFQGWKHLEKKLDCSIYFTNPYCSWEKGLVENMNRWIRVFIPKKTDVGLIHTSDIQCMKDYLNHTPRQCLDGYSAYEVMMGFEYKKTVESPLIDLPRVIIS